ncbi:MAG: translation initiation factor IF-2 subunit beta, partial [Candidatus Aenigmatarchaeota archaeon]
ALRRNPQQIAKFFFKELAVPGSITGDQLMLQGKISTDMINRRLDDYIKEFVICNECKKPDTNINKVGKITTLKCEACGAKKPVRSV